jgi:hypothetical protein
MVTSTPRTSESLIEIMGKMLGEDRDVIGTSCRDCQTLATSYRTQLVKVKQKEKEFNETEENSQAERNAARRVSMAVRLEATTSRRFLLHILKDHN